MGMALAVRARPSLFPKRHPRAEGDTKAASYGLAFKLSQGESDFFPRVEGAVNGKQSFSSRRRGLSLLTRARRQHQLEESRNVLLAPFTDNNATALGFSNLGPGA